MSTKVPIAPLVNGQQMTVTLAFSLGAQHPGPCYIYMLDSRDLSAPGVQIGYQMDCARVGTTVYDTKGGSGTGTCPGKCIPDSRTNDMCLHDWTFTVTNADKVACGDNCVMRWYWEGTHRSPPEQFENCADVSITGVKQTYSSTSSVVQQEPPVQSTVASVVVVSTVSTPLPYSSTTPPVYGGYVNSPPSSTLASSSSSVLPTSLSAPLPINTPLPYTTSSTSPYPTAAPTLKKKKCQKKKNVYGSSTNAPSSSSSDAAVLSATTSSTSSSSSSTSASTTSTATPINQTPAQSKVGSTSGASSSSVAYKVSIALGVTVASAAVFMC